MFRSEKWLAVSLGFFLTLVAQSQINSPYSRYGLGDLTYSRNVNNKAMGGLSAPFADFQTVNFLQAASYTKLAAVTFDVGMETELRTLRNQDKTLSYQTGNIYFNYLALGMPLARDKKGATKWGLAMGIRPYSRIGYKIEDRERIPGIDSALTLYEGSGGAYRAFLGTGYRIGGLSLGINGGFLFGQQNFATKRILLNDSVFYYRANFTDKSAFSRFVMDAGLQYRVKLGKESALTIGATGFIGHTLKTKTDITRETFTFNADGGEDTIDVVYRQRELPGEIKLPAGYTVGIMLEKGFNWGIGAEYEATQWNDYEIRGRKDNVANNSILRVGAHWTPSITAPKNYLKRITYRAGFFTGDDYIVANQQQLPVWGATFGFSLPLRKQSLYSYQYTYINTSFEVGRRGDASSPIKESYFKINLAFNLSDIWFQKIKYD